LRLFAATPLIFRRAMTVQVDRSGEIAYYPEQGAVPKWLRGRSAKPLLGGSSPPRASIKCSLQLSAVSSQLPGVFSSRLIKTRDRPSHTPGTWEKDAQPLRYLALRIRTKQGQLFASGADTKYLALVSNRWALPPATLLRWHWQKAGTIELVHDVIKNELGAAVPPCGRFGAKAAWYRLSLLTYNVLGALKSLALPPALSTVRPKRLRYTLFTLAGRLITHARKLVLRVSDAAERLAGLITARHRLALIAQALPAG
jgi:hypothetical protein